MVCACLSVSYYGHWLFFSKHLCFFSKKILLPHIVNLYIRMRIHLIGIVMLIFSTILTL